MLNAGVTILLDQLNHLYNMKIKGNRFVKIVGLAAFGGLIISPLAANAQDQGGRPPEFRPERPAAPGGEMKEKPDYAKIRGMVREMVELKRAGKQDEASQLAGKIKAATGNDPRICAMLGRVTAEPGKVKLQRQAVEQARPQMPGQMGKTASDVAQNPRIRLQNLREAARHLSAAGCEDLANGVRQQIAQMETRLKNQNTPQPQGQFQQRKETMPNAAPSFGGGRFGYPGAGDQNANPFRSGRFGTPGAGDQNANPFRSGRFGSPGTGGQNATPFRGGRFGTPGAGGQSATPFRSGRLNGGSPGVSRPDFRMTPKSDGVGPAAAPKSMGAPDANAAILSEIKKLRQEMGELRNQVRRVQANATPGNEPKMREGRPNAKERQDQRPNVPQERPNTTKRPDQRPNAPQERPLAPMPPQGDRPQ